MCSVSWLVNKQGYQVFFNRDEQKTRTVAKPPEVLNIEGVNVVMPIDPVGSGSWISLNEFGLSLCLLNNYQGQVPKGELVSRGMLLKQLSISSTVAEVSLAFSRINLLQFAPFTLLAFDPSLNASKSDVMAYAWDGVESRIFPTDCPLFSSGVDLERVKDARLNMYKEITAAGKDKRSLLKFHTHHHPQYSHLSTCMHREDAQTVSFTLLEVAGTQRKMSYVAGSPCQNLTHQALEQGAVHIETSQAY